MEHINAYKNGPNVHCSSLKMGGNWCKHKHAHIHTQTQTLALTPRANISHKCTTPFYISSMKRSWVAREQRQQQCWCTKHQTLPFHSQFASFFAGFCFDSHCNSFFFLYLSLSLCMCAFNLNVFDSVSGVLFRFVWIVSAFNGHFCIHWIRINRIQWQLQ